MPKAPRTGVCVGGAFDGKKIEGSDDTMRLLGTGEAEVYHWQPIMISGTERIGFWCHDTIGPIFAFQLLLSRYVR